MEEEKREIKQNNDLGMIIKFDKKAGDKLANLLCEVDELIKDGSIKVGALGLSPDSAKYCDIFYKGINNPMEVEEITFTDRGLNLTH